MVITWYYVLPVKRSGFCLSYWRILSLEPEITLNFTVFPAFQLYLSLHQGSKALMVKTAFVDYHSKSLWLTNNCQKQVNFRLLFGISMRFLGGFWWFLSIFCHVRNKSNHYGTYVIRHKQCFHLDFLKVENVGDQFFTIEFKQKCLLRVFKTRFYSQAPAYFYGELKLLTRKKCIFDRGR